MSAGDTIAATVHIDSRPYSVEASVGIVLERTLGMSPNMIGIVIAGNYVKNLPGGFNFGPSTPFIETGMAASILIVDGLNHPSIITPDGPQQDGWIEITDLIVHDVYLTQSPTSGFRTVVSLKDGRWKNTRGCITGQYNIPQDVAHFDSSGTLVEGRLRNQRTVKQLTQMCFAAMGLASDRYDITALDGIDWYPPVNWHFAVPAAEIERMMSEIGCGVAYLRDGSYKVVVLGDMGGQGVPPPYEGANIPKYTSVEELVEDNVYVVGGPIVREELSGHLEAVGEDVDGSIKPLRNLSYAPEPNIGNYGGFDKCLAQWGGFTLVGGLAGTSRLTRPAPPAGQDPYTDAFLIGLAEKSVWRMYRFNPGVVPDTGWATKLPWLPYIVASESRSGQTVRKEPIIYIQRTTPDGNTPFTDEPYEILSSDRGDLKYSIDLQTGVVTFNERVYLRDWPAAIAARVKVRYAYESATYIQDIAAPPLKAVREIDHYIYPQPQTGPDPIDPPGNVPLPYNANSVIPANATIIRRPELIQYNVTNDDGVESVVNLEELDAFAGQIVDMIQREDERIAGGDGTFPRLVDIDVNGAFRQITWIVNSSGAHTTVVCNGERPIDRTRFLTYSERINRSKYAEAMQTIKPLLLSPPLNFQFAPVASHGKQSSATSPGQQATRGIVKAAYNTTSPSEAIPRFSFVEIASSDTTGSQYRVKKPTAGVKVGGSIGVMTNGCPVSAFDDVCLAGEARVKIDATAVANVTVGTYVDPKPGAYTAIVGSSFLVLEIATVGADTVARIRLPGREGALKFRAKLTGWLQIGSLRKWKYAWSEAELAGDTYQIKSGGRTGTTASGYALNLREGANLADHAGTQGNGVNEAGSSYPDNFHLVPIGGGTGNGSGICANQTFVEMTVTTDTAGNTRYEFEATNSNDGTCE